MLLRWCCLWVVAATLVGCSVGGPATDSAPAAQPAPRAPSVAQAESLALLGIEYARAALPAEPSPTAARFFAPGESEAAWSSQVRLQVLPTLAQDNNPLAHARRIADEVRARHVGVKADPDPQAGNGSVLLDYFIALPDRGADGKRYLQFNAWRLSLAPDGQSIIGVHYAAKLEGPGGARSPLVVQLAIMQLRQTVLPALVQLPAYRP
jgi:hypothetical protein